MSDTIKLQIPLKSLVDAITSLGLEEKRQLLDLLEEQVTEAEEDLLEQDPTVLAEVEEARRAYRSGEYQTIQEYIANRPEKTS